MCRYSKSLSIAVVFLLTMGPVLFAIGFSPIGALGDPTDSGVRSTEQLRFSMFLGRSDSETAQSIVCDASGNAYVAGYAETSNFPTTPGAYDTSHNGRTDIFVAKVSPDGSSLLWSTFVGGSADDYASSIALDSRGDVVVGGTSTSTDFPVTKNCYDNTHNGGLDIVVLRLSADGTTLMSSTYIGGTDDEKGRICMDSSDDIYVSGTAWSTDYPTTQGAFNTTGDGSKTDLFVTKLKGDCSRLVYSTYVGGSDYEYSFARPEVDTSKNAYCTGWSLSDDFPTTKGCYDGTRASNYDTVVFRLDPKGGNLTASTFIGGSNREEGRAIALRGDGNVVTMSLASMNYPVTTSAYDTSFNGRWDVGVSVLDSNLTKLISSTYVGGSLEEWCEEMRLDTDGTVYLGGYTESDDFPIKADHFDDTHNGGEDLFVARLSPDLRVLYNSTYIGGAGDERGQAFVLGPSKDILSVGYTYSQDFPTTTGANDTTHGGMQDAFVLRLAFPQVADSDNDGVIDSNDAFPNNPYEYKDTDGDGMGDNLDPDADGDGTLDWRDAFPLNGTEVNDTDGDGIGDNADADDDGDGVNDTEDAFPRNPHEFMDTDGDGIGDVLDPDDDGDGVPDEEELWLSIQLGFTNISRAIDLLNATLGTDLEEVNHSLHATVSSSGSDMLDQLQGVNSTLAAEIQDLMEAITRDLAGLNATLDNDVTDLWDWLDTVLAAMDAQLDSIEGSTEGSYIDLDQKLDVVLAKLGQAEGNLSDLDADTVAMLVDIATDLGQLRNSTGSRLEDINGTLERLSYLDAIVEDLADLDQHLTAAQAELDATVEDTSTEEMASLNLSVVLMVLAVFLVALLIVMTLLVRRPSQPSPKEEARE